MQRVTRQEVLASYNILDTVPEPEFEDIVGIARRVCGTGTALVSLVDAHRQWFKARSGFSACETPLEQSVCAHALLSDEMLVIPDLRLDPRTAHNALVVGHPHIRFYAGAVLRSPQGVAFGSLCVLDDAPRPDGLTPDQAEILKALARQVMALLSMRRALFSREEVSAQLLAEGDRQLEAQEIGGIGTFEVDPATDAVTVSDEFRRLFGLPADTPLTIAEIQALSVVPAEGRHTTSAMRRDGLAPREVEYRIRRASDDAVRWVLRRTGFHTGASGAVERMIGTMQDITERKQSDLRREALVALGDALREVATKPAAIAAAARIAGEALGAARAGYARIDPVAAGLEISDDWYAADLPSLAGSYALESVPFTARLTRGWPLLVANVPAAPWLQPGESGPLLHDAKALLAVPLLRQDQLAGFFFVQDVVPRTWTRDETDFVVSVADRTEAAIARVEAEEQQRVLNGELSHRLKNSLSMVQAMVTQTLRGLPNRSVVRALEERIIALSKAHDVLLQESWSAAPMSTVVAKVTELHEVGRFVAEGPNILLGAKATLSLSLLLHELATNAVKYGALSVPEGSVRLAWQLTRSGGSSQGGEPTLVLTWTEAGGPAAVAPERRGFGSRLIAMGLVGTGRVKTAYEPGGFDATFEAPLHVMTEL